MAQDRAKLPEYEGGSLDSAAEAIRLLESHDPDSVVRALAQRIIDRAYEAGLNGLTDTEAQLAALEIYQSSPATDGFASLYYNSGDFVPAMLAATRRTGADAA